MAAPAILPTSTKFVTAKGTSGTHVASPSKTPSIAAIRRLSRSPLKKSVTPVNQPLAPSFLGSKPTTPNASVLDESKDGAVKRRRSRLQRTGTGRTSKARGGRASNLRDRSKRGSKDLNMTTSVLTDISRPGLMGNESPVAAPVAHASPTKPVMSPNRAEAKSKAARVDAIVAGVRARQSNLIGHLTNIEVPMLTTTTVTPKKQAVAMLQDYVNQKKQTSKSPMGGNAPQRSPNQRLATGKRSSATKQQRMKTPENPSPEKNQAMPQPPDDGMGKEREQIVQTIDKLQAVLRNIENVDRGPADRSLQESEVQPSQIKAMLANLQRQLDTIDVRRTVNEAAARVFNTANASANTKTDKQNGRATCKFINRRKTGDKTFLRV